MAISAGSVGGANPTSSVGAQNPFSNINLPGFNFTAPPSSTTSNPSYQNIQQLLSTAPASATNTIMPVLQQLYGAQANAAQPIFAQQTGQMVAQAQSSAQQRGLTGSSIESAGMLGAQNAGNQNYDQYLAGLTSQMGQAYTGAAEQDINTQNQMYQNLAQAMGQQLTNQQNLSMFNTAQANQRQEAQSAGQMGLLGSLGGGALSGIGMGAMMLSDKRDKKNVKGAKGGLAAILSLKPKDFQYNEGSGKNTQAKQKGFMAQDVQKVIPGAVQQAGDHKMLELSKIVANLVLAVQEMHKGKKVKNA